MSGDGITLYPQADSRSRWKRRKNDLSGDRQPGPAASDDGHLGIGHLEDKPVPIDVGSGTDLTTSNKPYLSQAQKDKKNGDSYCSLDRKSVV